MRRIPRRSVTHHNATDPGPGKRPAVYVYRGGQPYKGPDDGHRPWVGNTEQTPTEYEGLPAVILPRQD